MKKVIRLTESQLNSLARKMALNEQSNDLTITKYYNEVLSFGSRYQRNGNQYSGFYQYLTFNCDEDGFKQYFNVKPDDNGNFKIKYGPISIKTKKDEKYYQVFKTINVTFEIDNDLINRIVNDWIDSISSTTTKSNMGRDISYYDWLGDISNRAITKDTFDFDAKKNVSIMLKGYFYGVACKWAYSLKQILD